MKVTRWHRDCPVKSPQETVFNIKSVDVFLSRQLVVFELPKNLLVNLDAIKKDRENGVALVLSQYRLWVNVNNLCSVVYRMLDLSQLLQVHRAKAAVQHS